MQNKTITKKHCFGNTDNKLENPHRYYLRLKSCLGQVVHKQKFYKETLEKTTSLIDYISVLSPHGWLGNARYAQRRPVRVQLEVKTNRDIRTS
jgi:hypothetical protein